MEVYQRICGRSLCWEIQWPYAPWELRKSFFGRQYPEVFWEFRGIFLICVCACESPSFDFCCFFLPFDLRSVLSCVLLCFVLFVTCVLLLYHDSYPHQSSHLTAVLGFSSSPKLSSAELLITFIPIFLGWCASLSCILGLISSKVDDLIMYNKQIQIDWVIW